MPLSRADTDLLRKLLHAAGMLHVHGLIGDHDRRLIHARLLKWKVRKSGTSNPAKSKQGPK